jgi:hypothetical protein
MMTTAAGQGVSGGRGTGGPGAAGGISSARRDQFVAIVAGVVLMTAAQLLQSLVLTPQRAQLVQEDESSMQSLAVTFPRLTLGGFRGILSTALWLQAEDDKEARRWYELETKYDLIATLQPYFATVYIFHAWNQAYNLSAQWHDVDTKYKWVLDGLAYLYGGERYVPRNPDIGLAEAQEMYYLKLGGSFERTFYRAHWRSDLTRLHELKDAKLDSGSATDALQHVANFAARPEFKIQLMPDPSGASKELGYGVQVTDPNLFTHRQDGKRPEDPVPFRYGMSPYYFAYQAFLRTLTFGEPSMTGMRVLESEPAMSLRLWCRDDLYYSMDLMNQLFNANTPALLDPKVMPQKVAEVHDCYRNVQMIAPRSVELFQEHLAKWPMNASTHLKHVAETKYYQKIGVAESKLFDALVQWQIDQRQMTPKVKQMLIDALPAYDEALAAGNAWLDTAYPIPEGEPVPPERGDIALYPDNAAQRKAGIEAMLKTDPGQKPDMSFLEAEVVER